MSSSSMQYSLKDLQFPVYRLGLEKPSQYDGVLYYEYLATNKEHEEVHQKYILDDTNVPGSSLAMRRLVMLSNGVKLKKLHTAVFFLSDFIKLATASTWFIDSSGKLFQHKKKTRAKLTFRPISQIIPMQTGGAIIEVVGVPARFKTLFAPKYEKFAGLLQVGRVYILYGLYEEKPEDTWRLI